MKTPKMGRPPKGTDKRQPVAIVRASPAEAKKLRKKAGTVPLAVYLRKRGLGEL
jgi:hypothetical protein